MNIDLSLIVAGALTLTCLGWIYSLFMQRRNSKIRQKRMRIVLDQLNSSACCDFDLEGSK